jgi:hypothetical protein
MTAGRILQAPLVIAGITPANASWKPEVHNCLSTYLHFAPCFAKTTLAERQSSNRDCNSIAKAIIGSLKQASKFAEAVPARSVDTA